MSRATSHDHLHADEAFEVAIEIIGTDDVLEDFKCAPPTVMAHAGIPVSPARPPDGVLVGYRSANFLH